MGSRAAAHGPTRRNQNANVVAYERGRFYREERLPQGGDRKSESVKSKDHDSQKPDLLKDAAETIGKRYGVGPATVKRDAKYAEAVETLLSARAPRVLRDRHKKTPWHRPLGDPENAKQGHGLGAVSGAERLAW